MATASPAALDDFLQGFATKIGTGFGLIGGDVQSIFALLVVVSLGLSAVFWALDDDRNVPAALIRKILLFGLFSWLLTSWRDLSMTIANGFVALGLKAGGGQLNISDVMEAPSTIVADGLNVAFQLVKYAGELSREGLGTGFFIHFDAILIAGIAIIGIIIAFVVLAVEIAITVIEFHLVTLIALVTIPFGVMTQTAFLAERSIGYVASVGLKLMAMALIVSIGESIFATYTVSSDPSWAECCGLLLASVIMMMLALKIPAVAAALISGGPQLSTGSAVSGAAGLAAAAGAVALAGRLGGGVIAGQGAAAGMRQAANLAGDDGGSRPRAQAAAAAAPPSADLATAARKAPVATLVAQARASFRPARPPPSSASSSSDGGEPS
jgi:type IV secretion system protein TrbL